VSWGARGHSYRETQGRLVALHVDGSASEAKFLYRVRGDVEFSLRDGWCVGPGYDRMDG
jgi:hypothetical protein